MPEAYIATIAPRHGQNSPDRLDRSGRFRFRWVTLSVVLLIAVAAAPLFVPPAEDAAILFQYSDHLAQTGNIAYVAHGPHVEGATDFLWMLLLAAARCVGISPHAATGSLNACSLLGLGCILADVLRLRSQAKALASVFCVFLLTPQMVAALSGFSVLPFGFLLALMFWAYVRGKSRLLPLAALLLCLMRPDGVLFAVPLLGFDLARRHFGAAVLRQQALLFCLPGLLYMAWRVHYFHEWFPLPFLVKSQAQRWMGLLVVESLEDVSRYLVFALLALGLLWRWGAMRQLETAAIAISGIGVPTLVYLTLRLDQNLADRFFFYLVLMPAFLLCMHRSHFHKWTIRVWIASTFIVLGLFLWPYFFALVHLCTDRYLTNSLVAQAIRDRRLHGRLAVSEAGILAYETAWPTTDLWGLNTPEFAKRLVEPRDIARLGADLIVLRFFTCEIPKTLEPLSSVRTWSNMSRNVLRGASVETYQEFVLPYNQSSFASEVERFTDGEQTRLCYFVRRGFDGKVQLETVLTSLGAKKIQ